MKVFLRILLFISLVFVTLYLYTNDLLKVPELQSPFLFFISVILIIAGFLFDVKAWQIIARTSIPELEYKYAFISTGKFIFSKYIPGKLWIILGKAAYLKDRYKKPMLDLSSFSLFYQMIAIVTGTLTGFAVLFFMDIRLAWILLSIITLGIFAGFLFYEKAIKISSGILTGIFKNPIEIPLVPFKTTLRLSIISLFNWLVWALAFYIFLLSVNTFSANIQIAAGLLFPISSVIGILVLIAPGGLGFREGFLALGLVAMGLNAKEAASVAILSRLWFLVGEVVFFVTAFSLGFFDKNKTVYNTVK